MSNQSQKAWVYAQLKKGKRLTPIQAFDGCGTMRLAALIYDFREEGHPITTTKKFGNGKQWAEYRLARSK